MKNEAGKTLKVHPIAELYPLMSDEELDVLGEDIETNGLQNKLVRDEDGTLIDGRNREEAAKRRGIKLTADDYVTLNGLDSMTFIFSLNNKRRHVLKSQRAVIAVKARELEGKAKKTESDFLSFAAMAQLSGVSESLIKDAHAVLKYAPEHVDAVIAGAGVTFEKALEDAKERKAAAQSKEAQMNKLRKEASDLADLVSEERMALQEAFGALKERKETERRDRQRATEFIRDVVLILDPRSMNPQEYGASFVERFDPRYANEEISKDRLMNCLTVLKEITKRWKDYSDEIQTRD
jgi:hypothetical protein